MKLGNEKLPLVRSTLQLSVAPHPVQILEGGSRVLLQVRFAQVTADGGTLQIKRLVDIAVRWEEVVHDNEMDLPPICHFDPVKTIELRNQRVWVFLHMLVVFGENLPQDLMFGVVDGLDDILIVSRKVEEAPALARRAQLREDILAGERHEVIGRVEAELCPETSKYPRCIVLEFKVILGRRR